MVKLGTKKGRKASNILNRTADRAGGRERGEDWSIRSCNRNPPLVIRITFQRQQKSNTKL